MSAKEVRLLLPDVEVRQVDSISGCSNPVWEGSDMQVSQDEFAMQVAEVGSFYVRDGKEVEYSVCEGNDPGWVRLYLNGQVLVALLHQRKIITLHASSFIHDGRGVMILGERGAGKSSLTASFALKGARLLTDDVTPVIFRGPEPHIMPLHGSIRIRKHTAEQLNVNPESLMEAETGTGKQYLQVGKTCVEDFPLHIILKIEVGDVSVPEFSEPLAAEKFSYLRSEICLSEILAGMPETEAAYLQQLVQIIQKVRFVRVLRPAEIVVADFHFAVKKYLTTELH